MTAAGSWLAACFALCLSSLELVHEYLSQICLDGHGRTHARTHIYERAHNAFVAFSSRRAAFALKHNPQKSRGRGLCVTNGSSIIWILAKE